MQALTNVFFQKISVYLEIQFQIRKNSTENDLLKREGIHPYTCMEGFDRF